MLLVMKGSFPTYPLIKLEKQPLARETAAVKCQGTLLHTCKCHTEFQKWLMSLKPEEFSPTGCVFTECRLSVCFRFYAWMCV